MPELRIPILNQVTIIGNLTSNPTYNVTQNGTPVVNFYIASNKRFKDRSGQIKEDVCFVGVVAWEALALSCKDKIRKGSTVLISGELQSRKYTSREGFTRYVVEIKAKRIQFLDKYHTDDEEQTNNNHEFNNESDSEIDDDFGYNDLNI